MPVYLNSKIKVIENEYNLVVDTPEITATERISKPILYSDERMYPPTRNLTSPTHIITGQNYGNGVYYTSESSVYTGESNIYYGYSAFNTSNTTGFHGNSSNQYSGASYIAGNYIVNDYLGDWIKINLPVKVKLSKYGIKQRSGFADRAPGKYKIYGSNDDKNWDVLVNKTATIYYTNGYFEESITTYESYKYFAIVCNELYGSGDMLNLDEWYIYGSEQLIDKELVYESQTPVTEYTTLESDKDYLVAHYKFDAGQELTDSIGNYPLTNTGSVTFPTNVKVVGKSSYFPNSDYNGYLNITGDFNPYNIWKGNGISFSIWYNLNYANTDDYGRIFEFGSDTENRGTITARPQTNGIQLYWKTSSGNGPSVVIASGTMDDSWHHIVWTIDTAGKWSAYIDGVNQYISANYPIPNITYSNNRIGKSIYHNTGSQDLKGYLDDFRVYNKVLTETEIYYLANNMIIKSNYNYLTFKYDKTKYPSIDADNNYLIAHYKFDDNLNDSSNNNNNLVSSLKTKLSRSTYNTPIKAYSNNQWSNNGYDSQNCVFNFDIIFQAPNTRNECLFEAGGAGVGAYLGIVYVNSSKIKLRLRCGEGSQNFGVANSYKAEAETDITEYFDGRVHNITWEVKPTSRGRIRLWIDNKLLIDQTANSRLGNSDVANIWTGSNSWGYGKVSSSITTGDSGTAYSGKLGPIKSYANTLVNTDAPVYDGTKSVIGKSLYLSSKAIYEIPIEKYGDFTISFWFYMSSVVNCPFFQIYYYTISSNQLVEKSYKLSISSAKVVFNTPTASFTTTESVIAEKWHYITISVDGTNSSLYLDSVLKATIGTELRPDTTYFTYLGNDSLNTGTFTGYVNDFRIYNTILSQLDINTLYEQCAKHSEYQISVNNDTNCDILIVAGGGGGGRFGGGGGGGAILFKNNIELNGNIIIKTGKGGTGAHNFDNNGTDGLDSSITIDDVEYIAKGGGGGGSRTGASPYTGRSGNSGGSGGGGSQSDSGQTYGGTSNKNTYTGWESYGNAGGNGRMGNTAWTSGGGGGAGSAGVNATSTKGGDGGTGKEFITYFGTNVGHNGYFGGGGGGNIYVNTSTTLIGYGNGGNGLYGGGGNGGYDGSTDISATDGLPNTGGGGGGSKYNNGTFEDLNGGQGGSGIVIIRYNNKPIVKQWSYSYDNPNTYYLGNVGIGMQPKQNDTLTIKGDVNITNKIYKNNTEIANIDGWNKNNVNIYRETGKVGIGTTSPQYTLDINGEVYSASGGVTGDGSTSWTTISDRNLKENIVNASYIECYNNIKNINLYRFNYKDGFNYSIDKHQLGFIAQEVQEYYPKSVIETGESIKDIDNILKLDVSQINYSLFGAFKHMIEEVKTIEDKLDNTAN